MTRTDIADVKGGRLQLRFHQGQWQAWRSPARYVLVLAGTQSGKTSFGPYWLFREMKKRGPGDYIVVTPTFPLLEKKALPEFMKLFKRRLHLGDYVGGSKKTFTFSEEGERRVFGSASEDGTRVFFGHAQDPESLESATAKAAWLDEAGQKKFKLGSWEAIQRRLALHQGRALFTTTPYTLGWLKNELYDQAEENDDVEVIQFASYMNPAFPREEYDRLKAAWPDWKAAMMLDGQFRRPAGMIYDCFDAANKTARFPIPDEWPRYLGLDFGGANTAGVDLAKNERAGLYYAYRVYKAGGRTAEGHTEKLLEGEPAKPLAAGGSWSEDQWRDEFSAAGLRVQKPPVKDVEVGIDRVYGLLKENRLIVFDDLKGLIDELESYSRALDENDEPLEEIEDKNRYHRLDGLRYIATKLGSKSTVWAR